MASFLGQIRRGCADLSEFLKLCLIFMRIGDGIFTMA